MKCCECPDAFIIRGAVIRRIWPEVFLCILYATLIVLLDWYFSWDDRPFHFFNRYRLSDTIFMLLGVATSLLGAFRTNTANERHYEARKAWSDMTSSLRSLIRTFWIFIDDKNTSTLIVEKISAINLLIAFAYATKHYLREEYSYDEDDLMEFAGHLPHLLTPTSQEPLEQQEDLRRTITASAKRRKEKSMSGDGKAISMKQSLTQLKNESSLMINQRDTDVAIGTNIPLEITYYMSQFAESCKARGMLENSTSRVVDEDIGNLVRCLTTFERIRGGMHVPLIYKVHLTHMTWILLLILPFIKSNAGWMGIPLMTFFSFVFLGFLAIGKEIEDPFGDNYNDLNLDEFCGILHKEALTVTAVPVPENDKVMFSELNHPIPNNPDLTAVDMARLTPFEIRRLLMLGKSYRLSEKKRQRGGGLFSSSNDMSPDEFNIIERSV